MSAYNKHLINIPINALFINLSVINHTNKLLTASHATESRKNGITCLVNKDIPMGVYDG